MQLDKTVIIPTTNNELAKKLFDSLIYEEDVIVVVILGENDISINAVQLADKKAKPVVNGFSRKVCWVRDVNSVLTEINKLKPGFADLSKEDLSKVIAFSISLDNKVAMVLHNDEEIDYTSIEQMYLKAGV